MLEKNSRIAMDAAIVDEAITSRRSVRAFLPDMVEDETILAHCRGPGPHVRGCWVVDMVLGRA